MVLSMTATSRPTVAHDRREDLRKDANGPGDAQREAVGVGDGISLWQDFTKDQHHRGGDDGGDGHARIPEQVQEHCGDE
jgi:hypothetical protein